MGSSVSWHNGPTNTVCFWRQGMPTSNHHHQGGQEVGLLVQAVTDRKKITVDIICCIKFGIYKAILRKYLRFFLWETVWIFRTWKNTCCLYHVTKYSSNRHRHRASKHVPWKMRNYLDSCWLIWKANSALCYNTWFASYQTWHRSDRVIPIYPMKTSPYHWKFFRNMENAVRKRQFQRPNIYVWRGLPWKHIKSFLSSWKIQVQIEGDESQSKKNKMASEHILWRQFFATRLTDCLDQF